MGEQEPHPFCKTWLLREQALDETNKRACTAVRCEDRRRVFTRKRVLRICLHCVCEEPSVHVKDSYVRSLGQHNDLLAVGRRKDSVQISLMANAMYLCMVNDGDGGSTSDMGPPKPGTCRLGGVLKFRTFLSNSCMSL